MVNQRVTDWRFWGIKKLHELPEVLQAKTKTPSQNNLKNFLTSYLTTACIEPEYILQCPLAKKGEKEYCEEKSNSMSR